MGDLHIRVVDTPGQDGWTAELRTGFPGSGAAVQVAGGGAVYTRAQLERDDPAVGKLDLETVLDAIRVRENQDDIFAHAGARLFELLEATGVAVQWKALRAAGTRTFLELPPSIAQWPWELLMEVSDGVKIRYFVNSTMPVMRVHGQTRPGPAWTFPIRILLVSGEDILDPGSPEAPDSKLKASDELRDIREVFHKAGLSVLIELCESPATKADLPQAIKAFSPHIIHFIGHGDRAPGQEYYLQFKRLQTWEWTASEIYGFFNNEAWKPRLVVLNACHSSQFDRDAASVAKALLKAGIPAVIGGIAAFRVDYARVFAQKFYAALVAEKAIDKAVAAARQEIINVAQDGIRRRHWALPVLTVSAPPEAILGFKAADYKVKDCPIVKKVFQRPGTFADRVSDRWSILSAFQPVDGSAGVRGVILHSDAPAGKSWLVMRSIRDFLDAGYLVRYGNLTGRAPGRTSIDVLADWRGNSSKDSPVLGPVEGPHFDDFDKAYVKARKKATPAALQAVYRTFKQGLQSARAGRKVVLIIDEFRNDATGAGVEAPDFREGLMNQLLLPLQQSDPAEPGLEGVYALLVARLYSGRAAGEVMDEDEFGLARLHLFARHRVGGFPKCQVDNVFDEFSDFERNLMADGLRQWLTGAADRDPWSPDVLTQIATLVDVVGVRRP